MSKDTYILYSGATDVTGTALQKELKITGGKAMPTTKKKLIIGWGAKTDDKVSLNGAKVLNHPDMIKANRNKYTSLITMKDAGVNVAKFFRATEWTPTAPMTNFGFVSNYPLVGRRNYHQGGKGFWLCLNKTQVETAIAEGAQYFQEYIDIKDEYRLHIFDGTLIYAQKKVKRDNMKEAFVAQHKEKIANLAGKNNKKLDDETMTYVLERLGKEQEKPDMIIRSNTRGWKFSSLNLKNVAKNLTSECLKALKATKLDFGGVDCCVDSDGKVWIIEINSGPGLKNSSFEAYVKIFSEAINTILNPPATTMAKAASAVKKTFTKSSPTTPGSKKETLARKLELFQEMVSVCDDDEASALDSIAGKVFSR